MINYPTINNAYNQVSFYIVAHADDWQLFMQPNAYNDLTAANSKVVFIITTAGDAGMNETFWKAREEGLKSSVRFCLAPLNDLVEMCGTESFHHQSVNCWTANNATTYFLRLPDGNLAGNGFQQQQYQSLSKLRSEQINAITSVDGFSTYTSWSHFYLTLQEIILKESEHISAVWINYLNPDKSKNPNDHEDHIATGNAVQAMPPISNFNQALFTGYSVANMQQTISPDDLFWKAGMFACYEKAVQDISGYSTLKEDVHLYTKWCLSAAHFITISP